MCQRWFDAGATWAAEWVGSLTGFACALALVWRFYQGDAIGALSFLLLFVLQRSQNAGTAALHLKLDTLVIATPDAPNDVAGIEHQES